MWHELTDVSEVIVLMMEATRTPKSSVNFYQITRRYTVIHTHLEQSIIQIIVPKRDKKKHITELFLVIF